MRRMDFVNDCVNLTKAMWNIVTGKSVAPLRYWYDSRYPPTKFLRRNVPRIEIQCLMSGYPRTGTHWILNVVAKSSDRKTYSLVDRKITPETKKVCIVKIHARNKYIARAKALWLLPPHDFRGKYIYVYRDPRDAIISLYEFYKNAKDLTSLEPQDFLKLYDPIRQYRWEINAWVLKKHKDVLLIRFEDLKAHPVAVFGNIFNYLEIDAPVKPECIGERVLAIDSKNRPRATAHGWKHCPPEYQCIIDSVDKKLWEEIKLLGYEDV